MSPDFPMPEPIQLQQTRSVHQQRVFKALQYIHHHLDEALDVVQLARIANFAPSHFNVVFRGIVGESVYQHVRRLRLERAGWFLRHTGAPVKEVSLASGFDSHEAFTRAFRSAFGCSPRTFARRQTAAPMLPAPTDVHYRPDSTLTSYVPIADHSKTLAVRLIELPSQRLACVRHTGPYSSAYLAWAKLLWWAWWQGRLNAQTCFWGLNYDDETITPEAYQRYDAAITVEEGFRGDGSVIAQDLEGGLFAVTTLVGSYAEHARAWDVFLYQWLPQSGLALRALFGLDRYHPGGDGFRRPLQALATALRRVHVDLHIPVGPGPIGRSLLA